MAQPRRVRGKIVALGLVILAAAAAAGTCSRFSSDNLVSRAVKLLSPTRVEAVFSGRHAHRLRAGLSAKISALNSSKISEGVVQSVSASKEGTVAEVQFDEPLPFSREGWLLSVEIVSPPSR